MSQNHRMSLSNHNFGVPKCTIVYLAGDVLFDEQKKKIRRPRFADESIRVTSSAEPSYCFSVAFDFRTMPSAFAGVFVAESSLFLGLDTTPTHGVTLASNCFWSWPEKQPRNRAFTLRNSLNCHEVLVSTNFWSTQWKHSFAAGLFPCAKRNFVLVNYKVLCQCPNKNFVRSIISLSWRG